MITHNNFAKSYNKLRMKLNEMQLIQTINKEKYKIYI